MNDKQVVVICEGTSFQMENKINALLEQGGWRLVTCAIELGRVPLFYAVLARSEGET